MIITVSAVLLFFLCMHKIQTLELRNVALLLFCVAGIENKISVLLDFVLFTKETNESYGRSESRKKKLFMYVVVISAQTYEYITR